MTLTGDERSELEAVIRKRHGNAALARRARCVLLWAGGERRVDIRTKLACNDAFVTRWTKAFEFQGLAGLVSLHPGRAPTSRAMVRRTGAAASSRPSWVMSRSLPFSASGASMACSRIGCERERPRPSMSESRPWSGRTGNCARPTRFCARRGKKLKTTVSDPATPCPLDRVNRRFKADRPNALWVVDFTYVTWSGFVYVAFVIDVFVRRIVGWRASSTARTDFVLDALEQALHERRPGEADALIHHSDRGVQYVSMRYTERLIEAGIEPSVGNVGDSYDNALAETIKDGLQNSGPVRVA